MVKLVNRAKMTTSTTGTGTITLGSAVDGFQTFAAAGVSNGETVRYCIEDGTSNFELGSGVFTASGTTLTRVVSESSNSNNAINLSGDAIVFITAIAADIQPTTFTTTVFTATANQTAFTVSYTVGFVEVFLNGSKLSAADFTATNGTSIVLASGATVGDTVDVVAYATQTIANVYTQSQADARYLQLTGGTLSGDLSGTTSTFSGDVTIADKIVHSGDTNTAIRFPAVDTFSVETNGSEAFRIDSGGSCSFTLATNAVGNFSDAVGEVGSGNFCLQVSNTAQDALKPLGFRAEDVRFATGSAERMRIDSSGVVNVGTASGTQPSYFNSFLNVQNNGSTGSHASVTITSGSGGFAGLHFGDSDNGRIGQVTYNNSDNSLLLTANNSERFRIASAGQLGIAGANYGTAGQVLSSGGASAAPTWADAGGGGSFQFTASGSITAGNPVGIKPSGSVSKLEAKYTRSTIITNTSNRSYIDSIYVGSNKIVVLYRTSSAIIKAKVGTISGNSISFGSEVHVNSDTQGGSYCQVTYDSNSGNVIFVWTVGSDSDKGYIRAGTISGTTITLGSSSTNIASNAAVYNTDIEFDPDVQRGLVCYKESNVFQYTLFSLGGTGNRTITLVEDSVAVSGSERADDLKIAYDTSADKMVVMFRNASAGTINYIAGDVSSTSVTWGAIVGADTNFNADEWGNFDLSFVPTLNKVGFVYQSANDYSIRAGTITLSGTTITKNESEILSHGNTNDFSNFSMSADPSGNVLIVYGDADSSLPDKIRAIIGNYSGNTFVPTLSDFTLISSDGSPNHIYYGYYALCYTDSTNDKYVLMNYTSISDSDNNTNGYYTYTIPSTNDLFAYDNWVGLASQSVSDGASVDVTVQGGLNENQSNLTVGRKFYVQDDGTISTTTQEGRLIGVSTAATKLFLTNGSITIGPTGFNYN